MGGDSDRAVRIESCPVDEEKAGYLIGVATLLAVAFQEEGDFRFVRIEQPKGDATEEFACWQGEEGFRGVL